MRALLALMLLAGAISSQEPVFVRTEIRPQGEVWVGQRVSLYVTVLMAGRPSFSPRFDLPRVDGAVFLQAPGSPVLGTERIDGTAYTTQRFELMLFAQRGGELFVPTIGVRVALGEEEHEAETEPLALRARLPDGVAPGTPLITTSELTITQAWKPQPADCMVGDAFERTITIRARNVLGIAIPPVPVPVLDGLATYPADPLVEDKTNRGALSSTRTDVVTFVCSRAGTYELPALVYRWWNPGRSQLEQKELPGVSFTVAPNPDLAAEELLAGEEEGLPWFLLGSLVAAAGALWLVRRPALARWQAWQRRRDESELAYFKRLQRACSSSDPRASWETLVVWVAQIDRRAPSRQAPVIHEFAAARGADDLAAAAEELQRALLDGAPWSGNDLSLAATKVRGDRASKSSSGPLPHSLNPL